MYKTLHIQQGSTLITVLMMLLLLSIIGLFSVGGSFFTEQLVRNTYERNEAFKSSLEALEIHEATIQARNDQGTLPATVALDQLATAGTFAVTEYNEHLWNPQNQDPTNLSGGAMRDPADIIQFIEQKGLKTQVLNPRNLSSNNANEITSSLANNKEPKVIIEQYDEALSRNMNKGDTYTPGGMRMFRVTALGKGIKGSNTSSDAQSKEISVVTQSNYAVRIK